MAFSGNSYQYRQLKLVSGVLKASGSADVSASGELSGAVDAQLSSATSAIRAALILSGRPNNPQLKRSRVAPVVVPVEPDEDDAGRGG